MRWLSSIYQVWQRECRLSFRDQGVIIFFFALAAIYPLLYALIYNTEVPHDVTMAVIDDCRSAESRLLVRNLNATQEVAVVQYAANITEARQMMDAKLCYGILHIPADYSHSIGRSEAAHLNIYADMGLMLRYKQIMTGVTAATQHLSSKLQAAKLNVVPIATTTATLENEQVALGNTAMGLASAILPCILMLVLQQAMLLGIAMLHGGSRERRLLNRGIDPYAVNAPVTATVIGKSMCYVMMFLLPTMYVLFFIPWLFDYPQNGNHFHILAFAVPYLFAASFMGQMLKVLANDRESTFIALVFTSIIFVFLTGISWPRSSMSPFWIAVGDAIPSTWAAQGYIAMQSNGATLEQVSRSYWMEWLLAGGYFVLACVVEGVLCRPRYRRMAYYCANDPDALQREEYRRQAVDIMPAERKHFGW